MKYFSEKHHFNHTVVYENFSQCQRRKVFTVLPPTITYNELLNSHHKLRSRLGPFYANRLGIWDDDFAKSQVGYKKGCQIDMYVY